MGVFTAQPTSTLLAGLLLAAGFALLGTVLLAFVFAYRTTYGVFAQRVLIGSPSHVPGATGGWQRVASSIRPFPRVESDVRRRPSAGARAAAPTRAPPAKTVSPGAPAAPGASDVPVPGSRSPEPRPGPDRS